MPKCPRDEKGRFIPGYSGNPGGRPAGVANLIRAKYGDNLELLIEKLSSLLESTKNEKLILEIIDKMIDRVEGKSMQRQHIEHETPIPIQFVEGKDGEKKGRGN